MIDTDPGNREQVSRGKGLKPQGVQTGSPAPGPVSAPCYEDGEVPGNLCSWWGAGQLTQNTPLQHSDCSELRRVQRQVLQKASLSFFCSP